MVVLPVIYGDHSICILLHDRCPSPALDRVARVV